MRPGRGRWVHPVARTAWPAGQRQASTDYRLARITAAAREAAYMYTALRWVVFRDATQHPAPAPTSPGTEALRSPHKP